MESIIGTIQRMEVISTTTNGYLLLKGKTSAHLDREETLNELEVGNNIEVFIYPDKTGKLCASTKLPEITVATYGWAEVVGIVKGLGAFVDIGTTKEMLVSMDELPLFESVWPNAGDRLYVTLTIDRKERLLGIPATEGVIQDIREWAPEDYLGKTVKGYVYRTSKEGSAVITDEDYRGFIHYSERKTEPRLGELVEGRVIEVKEDGTLNLSLRPLKQFSMDEDAAQILTHLEKHGGSIPFTDKSDPEDIRATFHISKAAFKRALGKLMKTNQIKQENGRTYLVKE